MRRRHLLSLLVLAPTLAIAIPTAAQAKSTWSGTWKLNLAKSKFVPAALAPRSQTVTREDTANGGMKATSHMVGANGKVIDVAVTTTFNGKPVVVEGAPDSNTTRVYKRINARTFQFVTSVNGKVTTTNRTVISANGNTSTSTSTGKDSLGRTIHNVAVFDRQ